MRFLLFFFRGNFYLIVVEAGLFVGNAVSHKSTRPTIGYL